MGLAGRHSFLSLAVAGLLCACADLGGNSERPNLVSQGLDERLQRGHALSEAVAAHNERLRRAPDPNAPVMRTPRNERGGLVDAVQLDGRAPVPLGAGAPATPVAGERFQVDVDLRDVSLGELIQVIFEEYLRYPYTIAPDFKDQTISLVFHGKVSETELYKLFESVLKVHGAYVVYENGLYAVGSDIKKLVAQPSSGEFGYTTGVFRLSYLDAQDFLPVARQFLTETKAASIIDRFNAVVVNAPGPEVDAVETLQATLDVPFFEGKYLLLYEPQYLGAEALKALIDKYELLLGSTAKSPKKLIESEVVPGKNQLAIIAYNRKARRLIEGFLRRTDMPGANQRQVFQYPLSSQKASEIAATVKRIGEATFLSPEPIEVVADNASNSLFIVATPEQFVELSHLLQRMDYRPPAAYIDVTLLEVTLNEEMRYGVEWFLEETFGDLLADAALDLSQNVVRGLDVGVIDLSSNKFLALQLLATETDFTILSNPQVIVKNGATARVNIGQEISLEKAVLQTNTAGSSSQTQFERRDVSLTLEVTPKIGSSGEVQMTLKLKDERPAGVDFNDQPIFNKRELTTDLVMQDGQTLFLGGIMQRAAENQVDKVPLLGDVPYVGKLFSNQREQAQRTELVVFVTTTVIMDGVGTSLLNRAILSVIGGSGDTAGAGQRGGLSMEDSIPPQGPGRERLEGADRI